MIGATRKHWCHSCSSGVYEGSSAESVSQYEEGLTEWTANRVAVTPCSECSVYKPMLSSIIIQSIHWESGTAGWRLKRQTGALYLWRSKPQ